MKCFFVLVLATMVLIPPATYSDESVILGWVEKTKIMNWGVTTKMKLDTGALTSSMHATEIEKFSKDEESWVRFKISLVDEMTNKLKSKIFERKIVRKLALKGAGGQDHRYVVLMPICVGNIIYEEQFSLRDRSSFLYPLLIGRRSIQHWGLIDVTRTFTHSPTCDSESRYIQYSDREEPHETIGLPEN